MSRGNQARDYSAITWSVNQIENLALEAYWLDDAQWDAILECLTKAVHCLEPLAKPKQGDDCPWPECGDGSCRPICPGM